MKARHPDLPVFIVGHSMVGHCPCSILLLSAKITHQSLFFLCVCVLFNFIIELQNRAERILRLSLSWRFVLFGAGLHTACMRHTEREWQLHENWRASLVQAREWKVLRSESRGFLQHCDIQMKEMTHTLLSVWSGFMSQNSRAWITTERMVFCSELKGIRVKWQNQVYYYRALTMQ